MKLRRHGSSLCLFAISVWMASAQSAPPADPDFDQYLLGNWGGLRDKLFDKGIQPTVVIVTDPFGNPVGGERKGATDYTLAGLDLHFDTEKLGGWRGGQFTVGASVNFGNDLTTKYVGTTYLVQLASVATSQPRLTYLSYMQTLAEGKVNVLVGRVTINSLQGEEFMGSAYSKAFSSVGFDLLPQGIFINSPGAYGYPATTWGGRIRYSPTSAFYVQVGVYNGDSNAKNGSAHGIDFSMHGPLFAIGELGFRRNNGLARNIKLGTYYDGNTYKTSVSGSQTTRNANGLYGLYAIGDQQLLRWSGDRHLGIFGAFLAAPQARVNTTPYFFDGGLVMYGPNPKRPKDFLALGAAYGSFQNAPVQTGALLVPSDNEEVIELTYGYTVRPGLLVQPALQYLLNPRGNPQISAVLPPNRRVPNALATGINIIISP